MTPRKARAATTPRWNIADGLEEELQSVEAAARAVLAEHAGAVAEAFARYSPAQQRWYRQAAALGFLQFVEHTEPSPPNSHRKTSRPCQRCEPARWLLVLVGELRRALANDDSVAAVGYALGIGRLQIKLGLNYAEGTAFVSRQTTFARHERGPFIDEKKARNEQILRWNEELLTYPGGKPRERRERVRLILERCEKTYRDKRAEADYHKSADERRRAEVWNIGPHRINQLVPKRTRKSS
jgi:hypothetical protein